MVISYVITSIMIALIVVLLFTFFRKASDKFKKIIVNVFYVLFAGITFSSTFFIDALTDLNKLTQTNIGKAGTLLIFALLFFYNALILIYFGATSKIDSKMLRRLTIIFGLPFSIIMYAVLPWYLKASIGVDFSYASAHSILIFIEVSLAIVFPVITYWAYKPFKDMQKKDWLSLLLIIPFGLMRLNFGVLSALFGFGESNLKAGSIYQIGWLVVTIIVAIALYMMLSKKDEKTKYNAMLIISLSVVLQYFKIYTYREIELWNLPIHICNIGTILIFVALYTKWYVLEMFTYYINVFGATIAASMPLIGDNFWQFSTFNFMYEHSMLIVIPILSVLLGVIKRPKRNEIIKIIPLFLGYYLFSVICGAFLNVYDANVNYFYVIKPTIAEYLPFLMPLREITFMIGKATFYPIYWLVVFLGIVGLVYIIDFIYNYIYIFEDKYAEIRMIIADEKALKEKFASNSSSYKSDALFEVVNFQKTYKSTGKKVIQGIDLKVNAGEIIWLIGGNGSGKSTFIKAVMGIIAPDEGSEIYINGVNFLDKTEECKNLIGYMPDNHVQYENLTGKEYVYYVSSLYNMDKAETETKLMELAEKLGLAKAINNKIKTYSHGMRQKVALISAIIHNPKVLILDEPLSGLDYDSMTQIKSMIVEFASCGNSVIYSSHLYDILEPIANKIFLLKDGKIGESIDVNDREKLEDLQKRLLKIDVWGEKVNA